MFPPPAGLRVATNHDVRAMRISALAECPAENDFDYIDDDGDNEQQRWH